MKEEVDLIIKNAKIYTVDKNFSIMDEIAIKDGKVIAIGNASQILDNYKSDNILNAKAKPVFPGFIDSHCHFYGYGLSLQQIDLTGTSSFDEVVTKLISIEAKSDGWIIGRGWDQNDWETQEFPDKTILDSLFPNTPVFIKRIDGHAALVNQKALEIAGITINTQVKGGVISKKEKEITGILLDNAIDLVSIKIPLPSSQLRAKALMDAEKACLSVGLTTVDEAGLNKDIITLIDSMHNNLSLKIRIYAMLNPTDENFSYFEDTGIIEKDKLTIRSFKLYADGALGSRGAALLDPYSDDNTNHGLFLNTPEYISSNAKRIYDMGFQLNTHCIGDAANRMVLNIYGDQLKGNNNNRWRIEHAQVIHPNDLNLFGKFNIIPSVQPTHATSDMYWAEDRLGKHRMASAYAYKQLMGQNNLIVNGSDFPVESINPLYGFYAAISRMDLHGYPENGFQAENALSRQEALKAMTIWAAYANFEENQKGSLEPGKYADFVILEKDIIEIPLKEIPKVKVLKTFINGELVFAR